VGIRSDSLGHSLMMIGSTSSPGITWTGSVGQPTVGGGSIAFLQLVNGGFTFGSTGLFGPGVHSRTTAGQSVLDTASTNGIPQYQFPNVVYHEDASTALTPNPSDTTGIGVTNGLLYVTMDDQFSDYLMFKSDRDGSIWVTLRKMSWSCSGSASNTMSGWAVYAQDKSNSNSFVSTELPVWSNYWENVPWQP
jgi:hypothetical protein